MISVMQPISVPVTSVDLMLCSYADGVDWEPFKGCHYSPRVIIYFPCHCFKLITLHRLHMYDWKHTVFSILSIPVS